MESEITAEPQSLLDVLGPAIEWHGTRAEADRLWLAIERACNESDTPCPEETFDLECHVHAVLDDQRALDHLLYGARMAERLRAEEGLKGNSRKSTDSAGRKRNRKVSSPDKPLAVSRLTISDASGRTGVVIELRQTCPLCRAVVTLSSEGIRLEKCEHQRT